MERVNMMSKYEFEQEIFEGFLESLNIENIDDIDDLEHFKRNDVLDDKITEYSIEYSDVLISRTNNLSYIIMINNFYEYIAVINEVLDSEPVNNIDLLYSQVFYNIIYEYLNDNINEILNEIDDKIDEIENKNL